MNNRRQILAIFVMLCALPFFSACALAQKPVAKPKIGLIGTGKVGSALGRSWVRAGYEVMFSSLDLDADRKLAADIGTTARTGTPREAAAFGDVIVVAVPYGAQPALGKSLGNLIAGKPLIDASNPFPERDGEIGTKAKELGVDVVSARLLPGAHIVRAFNAVGAAKMSAAWQSPGKVGMPYGGDDKQAVAIAARLIKDVGYEPVLVGGSAMHKYLMPGTPLAGEHSPAEVRATAATLKP